MTMTLHRDVTPFSNCGGQVASGTDLFGTDYWCVYCGAKFNKQNPEMVAILLDLAAMDDEEDGGSTWMDLDPSVAWNDPESRHGRMAALYLRAGWEDCYHGDATFHYNVKVGRGGVWQAIQDAIRSHIDKLPEPVRDGARDRIEDRVDQMGDDDLRMWWEDELPEHFADEYVYPQPNGPPAFRFVRSTDRVYSCGRSGGYVNARDFQDDPETFIRFGFWLTEQRDWFNGSEYGRDLVERAIEEDAETQLAALASPRSERIEA